MALTSLVDRVHEVYATSYRRLVGQLTGVTGDPVEAEDAVMEAFARAVNSGRSFLAADNPEDWLRTVAVDVTRTRPRWRRSRARRAEAPSILPHDLPIDLPHDVAERTPQPGFDAVLDRAASSRRRRRTTVASGLAAAVVLGGLGAVSSGLVADDGSPDPAPTTPWDGSSAPDERLPSSVLAVLDDSRLQLWAVTGAPDGGTAALWRGCDFDPCRFAVVTRAGDEISGEVLGASFPTLTTVPGGWLVENRGLTRLSASGDRSEIFDTGPGSGDVMAGDTAVPTADGWRLLRGDKLVPLPQHPSKAPITGAYVAPSGRLVAAITAGSDVSITATNDGRTWEFRVASSAAEPAAGAVVAGNGDEVAVALLGDDPDGSVPVLGIQVSHDAGRTWTSARGIDTDGDVSGRLTNLSSLAVAPDGTTWLTTGSPRVVRIDLEGDALPIELSSSASSVFAVGDGVCVVTERGRYDSLGCSTDGGTTWSDQPLPGFG